MNIQMFLQNANLHININYYRYILIELKIFKTRNDFIDTLYCMDNKDVTEES